MSITDELRRLLDGRGVEYGVQNEGKLSESVIWDGPIGTKHSAFVSNENPDKRTGVILYATLFLTPEQAVEATMGRGTCQRVLYKPTDVLVCSECGAGIPKQLDKYCYLNFCPNCGRKVEQ